MSEILEMAVRVMLENLSPRLFRPIRIFLGIDQKPSSDKKETINDKKRS